MDRRLAELTRQLESAGQDDGHQPQFAELERRIADLDDRLGEAMRLNGDSQAVGHLEQQIAEIGERLGRTEQQLGTIETIEQAVHQLYQGLEENRAFASQMAEDAANGRPNA